MGDRSGAIHAWAGFWHARCALSRSRLDPEKAVTVARFPCSRAARRQRTCGVRRRRCCRHIVPQVEFVRRGAPFRPLYPSRCDPVGGDRQVPCVPVDPPDTPRPIAHLCAHTSTGQHVRTGAVRASARTRDASTHGRGFCRKASCARAGRGRAQGVAARGIGARPCCNGGRNRDARARWEVAATCWDPGDGAVEGALWDGCGCAPHGGSGL